MVKTIKNREFTQYAPSKLELSSSKLPKKCTGNKIINMNMLNDSLKLMSPTNFGCEIWFKIKSRWLATIRRPTNEIWTI